jgi:cytidylate kinase
MNTPINFEQCLSFIHCHIQPPHQAPHSAERVEWKRAVTLSRQSGCGAHAVAEQVARCLQERAMPDAAPWKVFDRNLVEKVIEDHGLPRHFGRFMPEDRISPISDMVEEVFGLHPPTDVFVEQTKQTIRRLAETGNVIIVGRGSNVITAGMPGVLHVRVVAPLQRRIENMQRFEGLGRKEAIERLRHDDLGRQRYLKKYFGKDIDDPLLYHMVVNTGLISLEEAARLISDLVTGRVPVGVG